MKKILFFLLIISSVVSAQQVYVSNDGSDLSGNGTISSPFLTLSKAASIMSNGYTIYIARGDTFRNDPISIIGKNNITITAYGTGADPVLTSLKSVTGWVADSTYYYSVTDNTFPDEITNIFINGYRAICGRIPSATHREATGGDTLYLIDTVNYKPNGYWDNAELGVRYYDWATGLSRVTSYTNKTFYKPAYVQDLESGKTYTAKSGTEYWIQNHVHCLATYNQWAYNNIAKKLTIYASSTPSNVTASYGTDIIYISNSKHIRIANIDILGAARCGILAYTVSNLEVDSVDFSYTGVYCMNLNSIKGGRISYCTGIDQNNMFLSVYKGNNIIIEHNYVFKTGVDEGGGRYMNDVFAPGQITAISTNLCNNVIVRNNWVSQTSYCSISPSYGNKIYAYNNFADYFNINKYDGGGVAVNTGNRHHKPRNDIYPTSSGRIINNIVTNGNTAQNSNGLYVDNYSQGFETALNFSAGSQWCILLHESIRNYFHHNTMYGENGSAAAFYGTMAYTNTINWTVDSNLFISKDPTTPNLYISTLTTRPHTFTNNRYYSPLGRRVGTGNDKIARMGTTYYNLSTWEADESRVTWTRTGEQVITPSVGTGNAFPGKYFSIYFTNPSDTVRTITESDVLYDDYVDISGNYQTYPFTIQPWQWKILIRAPRPTIFKCQLSSDSLKYNIISNVYLLTSSVPATSAFAIPGKTISDVSVSNDTIQLTVTAKFAPGDNMGVSYTKPESNMIKALYGELEMNTTSGSAAPTTATITSTGTGAGVTLMYITVDDTMRITLNNNAYFYDDVACTINPVQYKKLSPGAARLYLKCTSGSSTMVFDDITRITKWDNWTSSTNAASISLDVSKLVRATYIYFLGNNTNFGDISNLTQCTWMYIGSNNTCSGDIAGLTLLTDFTMGNSSTVTYSTVRKIKGLGTLSTGTGVTLTSDNVNQILSDLWFNRDEPKPNGGRTISLTAKAGSGAPTGQGIIDKANLQNYRSPLNDPTKNLWTITTR